MPSLVLASESPYRRVLLDRLRVPYLATSHQCDERTVPPAPSLEAHAIAIASAKAESLAKEHPDSIIIGSDQIAALGGEILHKPGTRDRAIAQLTRLSGSTHQLLTALALRGPDGLVRTAVDVHHMQMRELRRDEIERYVEADQPLDCCGSYKIESLGIGLFETIDGDDFTAIMGMSLISLSRLLRDSGFAVP